MSDETTARDRAISMAQRLEGAVAEEPGHKFLLRTAREAALVLRTLAGAPNADVAALPTPEDVAAEMSRRMVGSDTVARRQSLLDPACRALDAVRALQPAAPEGVDADLSCRFCSNNVEVITDEDSPECGDIECVQCAARWDGKTGALMWSNVAPLAAAPEGVDAADELAEYGIKDPAELLRRYKLMWAAAADELAAAQAAIQRVEALPEKWETEQAAYPGTEQGLAVAAAVRLCAREVRGALDGDTTEEET